MVEKRYDDDLIRETFRKYRKTFKKRLPFQTLSATLEHEDIISEDELFDVQGRSNTWV